MWCYQTLVSSISFLIHTHAYTQGDRVIHTICLAHMCLKRTRKWTWPIYSLVCWIKLVMEPSRKEKMFSTGVKSLSCLRMSQLAPLQIKVQFQVWNYLFVHDCRSNGKIWEQKQQFSHKTYTVKSYCSQLVVWLPPLPDTLQSKALAFAITAIG